MPGGQVKESTEFVEELLAVIRKHPINACGSTLHLDELFAEIPEVGKDDATRLAFSYSILLKYIMLNIGELLNQTSQRVTLFHGRTPRYNTVLLQSFESMLEDPLFYYRNSFVTIASLRREGCTPLQPTDLVSYENMKETECHYVSRMQRRSLAAILELPGFRGNLTHLDRTTLKDLRAYVEYDEHTKKLIGIL